ncbi:MAG: energy-coupling factor ABC transporter permease [Thermoplasmata archaeon]
MHIPDGLMHPLILLLGWILSIVALSIALKKVKKTLNEDRMVFMALMGAAIFMAQMLNFPIGGGTTGHLIGASLAVFLFGAYEAMIMMCVILVIQCLLFGDGGITALGLNLLNMAVIAPLVSAGTLKLFPVRWEMAGLPVAAWASVFLAAVACAFELGLSNIISSSYGIPMAVSLTAMSGYHALIGIGEAIISSAAGIPLKKMFLKETGKELREEKEVIAAGGEQI